MRRRGCEDEPRPVAADPHEACAALLDDNGLIETPPRVPTAGGGAVTLSGRFPATTSIANASVIVLPTRSVLDVTAATASAVTFTAPPGPTSGLSLIVVVDGLVVAYLATRITAEGELVVTREGEKG